MRNPSTAVLLVAAAAVLVACGEQRRSSPTAPSAAVAATLALSCDFTALKANARAYAASNQDPLFTIIGDLQQLSKNGPNPSATDKAFDGLARLAAMRGTSAQSSTATGAAFNGLTTGFIGCMESYITSTVPADFSVADALGPGWMYEVRGKDAVDGAAGAYERGNSPFWAAEAPQGWGTAISTTSPAKRFLIYGFRITDFLPNDPTVGSAFEIRTIPTIASGALALSSPLSIGLCALDASSTMRVQHVHTVLPLVPLVCGPQPGFAATSSGTSLLLGALRPHAIVNRLADALSPPSLEAAYFVTAVGGKASDFSPSAVIDMQAVTLSFVAPIADGFTSQPLADVNGNPVQVSVTTKGGTPLPNVVVTLAIALNSSSIAFLQDGTAAPSVTVSRTTDANGLATFGGVSVTKAGGYNLVATGSFDGVSGAPTISNSFNIKNK